MQMRLLVVAQSPNPTLIHSNDGSKKEKLSRFEKLHRLQKQIELFFSEHNFSSNDNKNYFQSNLVEGKKLGLRHI